MPCSVHPAHTQEAIASCYLGFKKTPQKPVVGSFPSIWDIVQKCVPFGLILNENLSGKKISLLTKGRVVGRSALKLFSAEDGLGLLPTLVP